MAVAAIAPIIGTAVLHRELTYSEVYHMTLSAFLGPGESAVANRTAGVTREGVRAAGQVAVPAGDHQQPNIAKGIAHEYAIFVENKNARKPVPATGAYAELLQDMTLQARALSRRSSSTRWVLMSRGWDEWVTAHIKNALTEYDEQLWEDLKAAMEDYDKSLHQAHNKYDKNLVENIRKALDRQQEEMREYVAEEIKKVGAEPERGSTDNVHQLPRKHDVG